MTTIIIVIQFVVIIYILFCMFKKDIKTIELESEKDYLKKSRDLYKEHYDKIREQYTDTLKAWGRK